MLRLVLLFIISIIVGCSCCFNIVFIEGAQIPLIKSNPLDSFSSSLPRRRDETCTQFANRYEPFDYFLLSIQWPGTACVGRKPNECLVPDFINDFTIHGLWPQFKNPATYPECCFNVTFDIHQLNPIINDMNQNWPSYYHPNDYFWTHEWLKHGTCANVTISQLTYFSNTLRIYSKMHLVDVLKKASIIPSHGSYSKQRMEDTLKNAGFPGVIACTRDKSSIEEVRFCVNRDSLQLMECDQALINDIHTHNPCKDTISYPPIH